MAHAFLSKRIVTPQGTQPGALLVEGEKIRAICKPSEIPADAIVHDCGNDPDAPNGRASGRPPEQPQPVVTRRWSTCR